MSKVAQVTGGSRGIGFGIGNPSILQEIAEIAEFPINLSATSASSCKIYLCVSVFICG